MEDYTMLRPSVLRAQKGNARETWSVLYPKLRVFKMEFFYERARLNFRFKFSIKRRDEIKPNSLWTHKNILNVFTST
jgi:hypothetical protein